MDILRLPPPIRRTIFINSPWRRYFSNAVRSQPSPGVSQDDNLIDGPDDLEPLDLSDPTVPERLTPADYNTYAQTLPPTITQLRYANWFFASTTKRSAERGSASHLFLFSAPFFRQFPRSAHPEVAFVGRQNAGKSSLLNALMFGKSDNATSSDPNGARVSVIKGRTQTMNAYGVPAPGRTIGHASRRKTKILDDQVGDDWKRFPVGGSLLLVDTPGYPTSSMNSIDKEVLKYLTGRKQLKKVYVLVESRERVPENDWDILHGLRRAGVPYQVVLTKADKYLSPHAKKIPNKYSLKSQVDMVKKVQARLIEDIDRRADDRRTGLTDILCVSTKKIVDTRHDKSGHRLIGIDALRWSILSACGFECDQKGQPMKRSMADITILD